VAVVVVETVDRLVDHHAAKTVAETYVATLVVDDTSVHSTNVEKEQEIPETSWCLKEPALGFERDTADKLEQHEEEQTDGLRLDRKNLVCDV